MNNEANGSYTADEEVENVDSTEEYAYKNVISEKENTRLYSVVSLACAILSVGLFFIPWIGLVLGLVGIGFSLISRKHLNYFEVLALVGLIVAIFGSVFSVAGIIFDAAAVEPLFFDF